MTTSTDALAAVIRTWAQRQITALARPQERPEPRGRRHAETPRPGNPDHTGHHRREDTP